MAVTFQVLSRTGALPVQSKTLGICARHAAKMVKAERAPWEAMGPNSEEVVG